MRVEEFADKQPRFVLEEYFAGETKAWGIVRDRFGTVRRQFTVDMTGVWDGEVLTLDEHFIYDDGETDRRTWTVRKIDEHRYEGTAADVIGKATGGAYGNASEYIRDLIRKDQERKEARALLQAAITEGVESGTPESFDAAAFKLRMRRKHVVG